MKKQFFMAVVAAVVCNFGAMASPDINTLLSGLKSAASSTSSSSETTETTTTSSTSGILDQLSSIGNALGIISSKTVDAEYLAGTWNYSGPAVAFTSDNFLAKAGGVAASTKIESELEPYYSKFGLTALVLTIDEELNFTMKLKVGSLSGTIVPSTEDGTLTFNFKAAGKVSMGSMSAYVNASSSSQMDLTFDVSKLMDLIQKLSTFTNNSSISTLSSLLSNYDGLTAGFTLKKQ